MSVDSVWIGVKKMTNKETIETIKIAISEVEWNYPMDYTIAFEEAIKALIKADKYRWHDLRKNPDDLPEAIGGGYESEYVLVMIGTPEWNGWEQAYYHHGKRLWSTYEQNVFAWRYIEPFEENKDDE